MNAPRVSVCMLACDHAAYVEDCVAGVLAQADDVSLELLIGDDCSVDGTSDRLQRLQARHPGLIRYHRHAERLGGTDNYRFLIAAARGEFIAHLDGDDLWLPGKLREQVAFLDEHPDCPVVYTDTLVVDDRRRALGTFCGPQPERIALERLLRHGNFLNTSSMLFRTALRDRLLSIDGPFIDYQIHLRLMRDAPGGFLGATFTAYRHASSTSVVRRENRLVRECYWKALLDLPERVPAALRRRAKADFLRRVLFRALRLRDPALAREWLCRVRHSERDGRAALVLLALRNVGATALGELGAWLQGRLRGGPLRVFYR